MMRLKYPVFLGALLETRIFRLSRRSSAASSLGVSRSVKPLCTVSPLALLDVGGFLKGSSFQVNRYG